MGLDMYAYKIREQVPEHGFKEPNDPVEIGYWCKHPNLHGWMEKLYQRKTGFSSWSDPFNGVTLWLDLADIDALEIAVKKNKLPKTTGFFFGVSQPEEKDRDLQFIKEAREAIKDGYTVYYYSCW